MSGEKPLTPVMPESLKPIDSGVSDGTAKSKEDAPKPLMITAPPVPEPKAKESSAPKDTGTAPSKLTAETGAVVAAKPAALSVASAPKPAAAPKIPSAENTSKSEPKTEPEKPKSLLARIMTALADFLKPKPKPKQKQKQKQKTKDGGEEGEEEGDKDKSEEKDPLTAVLKALMELMIKMILALFALLGGKDEEKNKDAKKQNVTIESANGESADNTVKNAPKQSANPKPTNVFQEFHQQSQKTQAAMDEMHKMFADLKGQKPNEKQASQPGGEFKKPTTFSSASHGGAPPKPSPQAAAPKAEDPAVSSCAKFIKEKDLQKQLGDFLKDPSSEDGRKGYRQLLAATHSDATREMGEAERKAGEEIYKQVGNYKRGFDAKDAPASGKQPADAKSEKKEADKSGLSSELKDSDFARGDKVGFKEASSFLQSVNTKIESDQKLGDSDKKQAVTPHKTAPGMGMGKKK